MLPLEVIFDALSLIIGAFGFIWYLSIILSMSKGKLRIIQLYLISALSFVIIAKIIEGIDTLNEFNFVSFSFKTTLLSDALFILITVCLTYAGYLAQEFYKEFYFK